MKKSVIIVIVIVVIFLIFISFCFGLAYHDMSRAKKISLYEKKIELLNIEKKKLKAQIVELREGSDDGENIEALKAVEAELENIEKIFDLIIKERDELPRPILFFKEDG